MPHDVQRQLHTSEAPQLLSPEQLLPSCWGSPMAGLLEWSLHLSARLCYSAQGRLYLGCGWKRRLKPLARRIVLVSVFSSRWSSKERRIEGYSWRLPWSHDWSKRRWGGWALNWSIRSRRGRRQRRQDSNRLHHTASWCRTYRHRGSIGRDIRLLNAKK